MSAVRGRGKFQLMPTRYVGLAARGRSAESPRERENRLCRSFDFAEIACGTGILYLGSPVVPRPLETVEAAQQSLRHARALHRAQPPRIKERVRVVEQLVAHDAAKPV